MQTFSAYRLILTLFFAMALSGCATMVITGGADVDKSAFGAKKRFAVVSVAAYKTFRGGQGVTQLFSSNDDIAGINTQPLINGVKPKIISSLRNSRHFTLLPENAVFSSRAYKNLREDERVMKVLFFSDGINVANNYKYVADESKFAQLARELGVDGVIGITMHFSISSGKGFLSYNGLAVGQKSYSATAAITAIAYNRDGKVIWKDSTTKEAEPGDKKAIVLIDITDATQTNFEQLHPSAIEIGGKAVDVLLARFDDTMAGKSVSFMQSVK